MRVILYICWQLLKIQVPEMYRVHFSLQNKMIPLENYGVQCMSMGFLVNPEEALVWRGPMVMGAINKLIFDTNWTGTDFLIVDLPPGTGDIHLSLHSDEAQATSFLTNQICSLQYRKGYYGNSDFWVTYWVLV